jgi:hypothetical protein
MPPAAVSSPLAPLIVEKRRGSSALTLLLGVALVVAVGGVAFAAGRLTAPATAASTTGLGRGGNGTGFGGAGAAPGASGGTGAGAGGLGAAAEISVQGTVQSVSPTEISLTLPTGATIQIPVDSTTKYHGQSAATASDVKAGSQVLIQVGGGFGGLGGFGGRGGQGGPNASAPAPVGSPGNGAPAASPRPSGGTGGFPGARGAVGPARDVTIVAP